MVLVAIMVHILLTIELYDLDADIAESVDLAAKNHEVVAKLRKMAEEYDANLKANVRPVWRAGS